MKKKLIVFLCSVMAAASAVGCGNGSAASIEGTEAAEGESVDTTQAEEVVAYSSAFDLNASDYVKLCDYSAINVMIDGDYEVSSEDLQSYLEDVFAKYGPFYTEDTSKTKIGDGDIVNVDYVGKLDGVAFDGGTAQSQNIDVDANASADGTTYIEGFTDGLKGASVGDVIDCDVTFPENYTISNLAGQAVVFTFTVNSIQKEITIDDIDDTFAQEEFGVDTVDEMYTQIQTYLENLASYNKSNDTYNAVQDYLTENCTVDVPEDYLEARVKDYERQFVSNYCDGDESQLESYLDTQYGKTVEEMEESWRESMSQSIQIELIMLAIADELGIEIDEDAYAEYAENVATNNGYESADAMYEIYGYGDAAYGEKYTRAVYLCNQAMTEVMNNAVVEESGAEE